MDITLRFYPKLMTTLYFIFRSTVLTHCQEVPTKVLKKLCGVWQELSQPVAPVCFMYQSVFCLEPRQCTATILRISASSTSGEDGTYSTIFFPPFAHLSASLMLLGRYKISNSRGRPLRTTTARPQLCSADERSDNLHLKKRHDTTRSVGSQWRIGA